MALYAEARQLVKSGGDRDRIVSEGMYREGSNRRYRGVERKNESLE